MKAEVLGLTMFVSVFAVRATPSTEVMVELLQGLVERIGMTTGGLAPAVWYYPWEHEGLSMGGEGETVVLPFLCAQPLMESLSCGLGQVGIGAGDTWKEHGGTYVILASCRPYSTQEVIAYLFMEMGPVVDFSVCHPVSLQSDRLWRA